MSVENNYSILTYTATENQDNFIIPWDYQEADDIFFTINGFDTVRLNEEYVVTVDGITLNTPLLEGEKVIIYRKTDLEQIVEFLNFSKITGTMLQNNSDNIYYILQELSESSLDIDEITQIIEDTFDGFVGGEITTQEITKSGSSSGVVSGLKIRQDGLNLVIETGYGYGSDIEQYSKAPKDITVNPIEVTEEIIYGDFTGLSGLFHIFLSSSNQVLLLDNKDDGFTGYVYLGYLMLESEVLSKVVSLPQVIADTQQRLNRNLDKNITFENLNIQIDTIPNLKGLSLGSNFTINAAANNYDGEIGFLSQKADIDTLVVALGTNGFMEFGYSSDGLSQQLVSTVAVNVTDEILNKIDDRTSNFNDKNLIDTFQNMRICVSKKGELAITRGQADYLTQELAIEALTTEIFTIQESYKDFIPVYALTAQANVVDFNSAVLTKFVTEGGLTEVDFIDITPTGTLLRLSPNIGNSYDSLIPMEGQANILTSMYPELASENPEYITDTALTGFQYVENYNPPSPLGNISRITLLEIDNTVYMNSGLADGMWLLNTSNNTYTNEQFLPASGERIMIPSGNLSEVLCATGNNGVFSLYNFNTQTIIGSQLTVNSGNVVSGHFNAMLGKYVVFTRFGVWTTIDNVVWQREYSNNTAWKDGLIEVDGNTPQYTPVYNEFGDTNYLNGNYYIHAGYYQNVYKISENNLSLPSIIYSYPPTAGGEADARNLKIRGNTIMFQKGFDTSTYIAYYAYSIDEGVSWIDFQIDLSGYTFDIGDFEFIDEDNIIIVGFTIESDLIIVKDFKTTPVLSPISNVPDNMGQYGGFIISNNLSFYIGIDAAEPKVNVFNNTLSGGDTFLIPDLTSENDIDGKYKTYLKAGKKTI
jgi:hypothetical protein